MENTKKTILFVTLMSVFAANAQARSATPAGDTWGSYFIDAGRSALGAMASIGGTAMKKGAIPLIGTAVAATILPFGLGTIAKVAAPYLISAGAQALTSRITGRNKETSKRERFERAVERATRRAMNRSRRRHRRHRDDYDYDYGYEEEDYSDDEEF